MPRTARDPAPHDIPGEDRTLGGASLYIDLVPTSCWGGAARTALSSQYEWARIRKMVYERAGNACEVCGNTRADLEQAGYAPRLHAHERYIYLRPEEPEDHFPCTQDVQRLGRLICQCLACDEVTHFGRTSTLGPRYTDRAREHAQRVNDWTRADFSEHLDEAMAVWRERGTHHWKLDVTVLRNAGGILRPEGVVVARQWGVEPREIVWSGEAERGEL